MSSFKSLVNAIKNNMEVTSGRIDKQEPEAALFHGYLGSEKKGFKEYVVTVVPTELAQQEKEKEKEEEGG